MALEERIVYDHHVRPDGQIEVRQDTQIWKDGKFLAHNYHRHVLHPGADISQEDEQGKRIAKAVHTPDVIEKWNAAKRAQREER